MKRNIGPDGIRIRAFVGVLFIVFAMGLTALLTAGEAPIALRMVVFVPVLISTLSLLQAATGVCVLHAMRGVYSTQMDTEPVEDDHRRRFLVRRSRYVQLLALGSALLLTLALVALSVLITWRIPISG
ncbi:uncharacterized protein METZ01_LOCUS348902 [marine metagenome]|uniref:Uncharacterized protein n=1 Tax=marine metagenome TaxID=408172 RepID=A0A382RGE7_9ZZZZ